jgi:hypothetical protein
MNSPALNFTGSSRMRRFCSPLAFNAVILSEAKVPSSLPVPKHNSYARPA